VERDDASVAHGGEAEPGVAQRGAVRVLAVDEAQVGAVRQRARVHVLGAELDRRDLAQVGARYRSEEGEHALGAVVRVLPPVADLRALVRLHERTRIDRRDVGAAGLGDERLERTAEVRADLEVPERAQHREHRPVQCQEASPVGGRCLGLDGIEQSDVETVDPCGDRGRHRTTLLSVAERFTPCG
jgi:hypothetical protein